MIERRFLSVHANPIVIEKRQVGGKDVSICSGYAAVFFDPQDEGTEYMLYPGMRERVMRGAFDRCLRERQDIRGLFNHAPDNLLGRISSGTMRLAIDGKGLRYEIDLPDTQTGRDVAEMIRRGDLTGSSFSFMPVQQRFEYYQGMPMDSDAEDDIRELIDVDVQDVGPVSFAAYASTTTSIRAIGDENELRCACEEMEPRGVVRFQQHDLIDDKNWDADAAMERVKSWASEGDRMNMNRFSRAFAWHDGTGTRAGMKLLHHDVRDGKLMTHRGAVDSCMGMMDKEDGGGIPEDDRAACRSHLERHRSWDDDNDADQEPDMDEDDWMDERMRMRQQLAEAELRN